ncbi:hypothetical protein HMPREF1550_00649 [Actinomyces sp. oral taxon 877 str. F0543]|nr:hypothetical protein HMPREF1550_00649 [Actinomyces sp. oral taxon 877 str. F0543]
MDRLEAVLQKVRVREHPAPPGALRPEFERHFESDLLHRQGAPSTTRCIKTPSGGRTRTIPSRRQGAPSTTRCIKTRLRCL